MGLGAKGECATLVGRKVPMTSEVFWVSGGPPGGGGGTTRGPAIVGCSNASSSGDTSHPLLHSIRGWSYKRLNAEYWATQNVFKTVRSICWQAGACCVH